jgi:hypothetical protein
LDGSSTSSQDIKEVHLKARTGENGSSTASFVRLHMSYRPRPDKIHLLDGEQSPKVPPTENFALRLISISTNYTIVFDQQSAKLPEEVECCDGEHRIPYCIDEQIGPALVKSCLPNCV